MKTHNLKIWPIYFEAISSGGKNFEVRENDRDFKSGDKVVLEEYVPGYDSSLQMDFSKYTGRTMEFEIGYVYRIPDSNKVVFSLVTIFRGLSVSLNRDELPMSNGEEA